MAQRVSLFDALVLIVVGGGGGDLVFELVGLNVHVYCAADLLPGV